MAKENDLTIPGSELTEESIRELVGKLQVRRCIKYKSGDPPKTYGNVSPDDMSYEETDEESINTARTTQEDIRKLAKENPGFLPVIVNELVNKGVYYKSIGYVYMMDRVAYEMSKTSESWPDALWSSQMIAETVIGIGHDALPFLEKRDEEFAKNLVQKLRSDKIKMRIARLIGINRKS